MPSALRRADTNTSKTASMSMASMLSVPATILTSCPLRDVLAILIILLQLPPTVLTVVQFLFATLTFVPPQAGTPLSALSAFPSFTDIFQGSGGVALLRPERSEFESIVGFLDNDFTTDFAVRVLTSRPASG